MDRQISGVSGLRRIPVSRLFNFDVTAFSPPANPKEYA